MKQEIEIVEKVWLSAVFDEKVARSLPEDSPELERAIAWHWTFRKDLEICGLINPYLEELVKRKKPQRVPQEELRHYYRAFFERLRYEERLRKTS